MTNYVALGTGVCEVWPVDDRCYDVPDGMDETTRLRYLRAASDYLWAMTGRRYGKQCPVTVRPCRKSCADGFGILDGRFLNQGQYQSTGGWIPYLGSDGEFRNASLCGCVNDCHCGPELCEIELSGPVYEITEIDINGSVLGEAFYRVDNGRFLVRQNYPGTDAACWPMCQDMTATRGQPDTFTVTYSTGLVVPALGVLAVTQLANHFMRGCGDGCGCGVGSRENVSRITRQGIELEFADAQQVFTDGRTGIEIPDQFIRAFNPYGLASPMRVLSPDYRRPRLTRG